MIHFLNCTRLQDRPFLSTLSTSSTRILETWAFSSEDSGVLGCTDKVSMFLSSLLSTPAKLALTVDCVGGEDNVDEFECLKEKQPKSAPHDLISCDVEKHFHGKKSLATVTEKLPSARPPFWMSVTKVHIYAQFFDCAY